MPSVRKRFVRVVKNEYIEGLALFWISVWLEPWYGEIQRKDKTYRLISNRDCCGACCEFLH